MAKKLKVPYEWEPIPTFRTNYERDAYVDREVTRWHDGFNGLTGAHYFYLSRVYIADGTERYPIHPKFRDVDKWIFDEYELAKKNGETLGILKRREFGLTSAFAGGVPLHTILTNPGSAVILTSCDHPRVSAMFSDKTTFAFDRLDDIFKPQELRRNETKIQSYLRYRVNAVDSYGLKQQLDGEIYCAETATNPKAFSSKRVKYGFFDEFPLHPKRSELLGSSHACFMKGPKKEGVLVWGGTVEYGIPAESLEALQTIYMDAEHTKTRIFVVEGWMGLVMDENGNSDKKKGLEWIETNLAELEKAKDKRPYFEFKASYPRNIDDIFEMGGASAITEDVMLNLKERKSFLRKNPPAIKRYVLEELPNGKPSFKIDPSGYWEIYDLPTPGHKYVAGNDPIPYNNETKKIDDKRSKDAMVIKDLNTQTYVAKYIERSHDSTKVAKQKILGLVAYNNCGLGMERNASGVARDEIKNLGYYHLLLKEPLVFRNKQNTDIQIGWSKNIHTKAIAYNAYIEYLRNHYDKIYFMSMIESAEQFLVRDNDDELDAIVSCEVFSQDIVKRDLAKFGKIIEVKTSYRTVENGVPMIKFQTRRMYSDNVPLNINDLSTDEIDEILLGNKK